MRLSWILMLLALVLTSLRAGEAGAEAGANSAPAVAPVSPASSAPTSAAAPAAVEVVTPAVAAAPTYMEYHLANELIQVDITDLRGAIRRVSLLKTHPIHLREWQIKIAEGKGQQTLDPNKALPVLADFNPSGGNHNWISDTVVLTNRAAWKRVSGDDRHLILTYDVPDKGLRYTIAYALRDASLSVESTLTVENFGSADVAIHPKLYPLNGVHQDDITQDLAYLAYAYHTGGVKGNFTALSLPPIPGTKTEDFVGQHHQSG